MQILKLLITLFLLTVVEARAIGPEDIYGTWRLVSYTWTEAATGKKEEPLGAKPSGVLGYSRDGRVYAVIVGETRPKPADLAKVTDQERVDLFKTMVAYAGTFTFDGKVAVHHVDISWNGTRTGTDLIRNLTLEGRRLAITSNIQPNQNDGRPGVVSLIWERIP